MKGNISIHALRGEGDKIVADSAEPKSITFQSTPSVGRATRNFKRAYEANIISIHALRGEGDAVLCNIRCAFNISIHALRGEGDVYHKELGVNIKAFQSTPSVGRATATVLVMCGSQAHFNPRPPWGGRHKQMGILSDPNHFNPRPPWGGRPCIVW